MENRVYSKHVSCCFHLYTSQLNWPTDSHVVIKSSSKKQQHWLYRKLTLDCLSWAIILLLKSLYSKISNSNITKNSLLYVFQKSKYSRWPGKTRTNSPRLLQLWCEPETGCMMHNKTKLWNEKLHKCLSSACIVWKKTVAYTWCIFWTPSRLAGYHMIAHKTTADLYHAAPHCHHLHRNGRARWTSSSALVQLFSESFVQKRLQIKSHMFNLCVGICGVYVEMDVRYFRKIVQVFR